MISFHSIGNLLWKFAWGWNLSKGPIFKFSRLQNTCYWPSLETRVLQFTFSETVSFIVFANFIVWAFVSFLLCLCELYCLQCVCFMLSAKPLCSIVLLPFSAILTNLILFLFHVPNTTVLMFTVKPFYNLSLPLSAQFHLGCYVPGRTDTQWPYSIMVCIILLCFFFIKKIKPKILKKKF